jgi:hypothetical protein
LDIQSRFILFWHLIWLYMHPLHVDPSGLSITALYSPTSRHSAHTVAPSRSAPYHNGCTQFHGWAGVHSWYRQRCSAVFHHTQTLHDIQDISVCPAWVPPGRCKKGIQYSFFGASVILIPVVNSLFRYKLILYEKNNNSKKILYATHDNRCYYVNAYRSGMQYVIGL